MEYQYGGAVESIGLSVSRLSSDHLPFSRWLVSDLTGLRQSSSAMVTNGTSVSSFREM